MTNAETLATSDTQDTGQNKQYLMLPVSLCCSFLNIPSVYSSVYFVLCLVYPMLTVSLCCLFLIVLLFTLVFLTSDTQDTGKNKH
jgi:hypothetical protein